jgi:hypothetical protein
MRFLFPNFKLIFFIFNSFKKLFIFSFNLSKRLLNWLFMRRKVAKKVNTSLDLCGIRFKRLPRFCSTNYTFMETNAFKDYFKELFGDVLIDTKTDHVNKQLPTGHLVLGFKDISKLKDFLISNNTNFSIIH